MHYTRSLQFCKQVKQLPAHRFQCAPMCPWGYSSIAHHSGSIAWVKLHEFYCKSREGILEAGAH